MSMYYTMFADFKLDTTNHLVISKDFVKVFIIVVAVVLIYFFSYQIQLKASALIQKIGMKLGTYSVSKEYQLQRFTYQHPRSPITRLYNWVNVQIIAMGLKRLGITVVGYLLFWGFAAILMGTIIGLLAGFQWYFMFLFWIICLICMLIMTRVTVSEQMEHREADIMNAIDLIVPEVNNGVKNAIVQYRNNFAPSVKDDFEAFITNVQDRGFSFEEAMFILADNLGPVFRDFAQKAVYYEQIGEKDMIDIFSDITETNRLRRQLREENNTSFAVLKSSFVTSAFITVLYFFFMMFTDDFSRYFFLSTTVGKLLLMVMILIIFSVLAYISTIKSRTI